MSKFNKVSTPKNRTTNLAGGKAYTLSDKQELVTILLTSFLQNQFYRSESDTLSRVKELISKIDDKKFIAKLAIFSRNTYGMRSITHVTAGELAKSVKGENWTRKFYEKVVYRVDDILEVLSYYLGTYGKPLPNSLRRGLADSVSKFDEYQLAKYKGSNKKLSLIDAFNLIRPKPREGMETTFKKLMNDELVGKDTFESELSKAGQEDDKESAKESAWEKLIIEKKIGYMALLKNIRNIANQSPKVLDKALEMLVDDNLIKKSKVLPIRFLTAIETLSKEDFDAKRDILVSFSIALEKSLCNVPKFEGKTCVVLDESASMTWEDGGKPWRIGSVFAGILCKENNADLITFANNARYIEYNPLDSLSTIIKTLNPSCGGTNLASAFQEMNKKYDRIVILSDMQSWIKCSPNREYNDYCKNYDCSPFIYSWDLAGYGSSQFPESKIALLAGFSDKVFDLMEIVEQDKDALIKEIESVEL
jgi:hypothetical protein